MANTTFKINKYELVAALTTAKVEQERLLAEVLAAQAAYNKEKVGLEAKHNTSQEAWMTKVLKLATKRELEVKFNSDHYYANRNITKNSFISPSITISPELVAEWPGAYEEPTFDPGTHEHAIRELSLMIKTLAMVEGDTVSSSLVMKYQRYL